MSDQTPVSPAPHDWTDEVVDRIESMVGTVRDRATAPVIKVAQALVFGLIAAVMAVVLLVLSVIGLVRLIDAYLPFHPLGRRVWVTYAGLGAIFLVVGAFCWSRRTPQEHKE
jgi:hypothetical protein